MVVHYRYRLTALRYIFEVFDAVELNDETLAIIRREQQTAPPPADTDDGTRMMASHHRREPAALSSKSATDLAAGDKSSASLPVLKPRVVLVDFPT